MKIHISSNFGEKVMYVTTHFKDTTATYVCANCLYTLIMDCNICCQTHEVVFVAPFIRILNHSSFTSACT